MGDGPIMWTAIQKYSEVHRLDEEQERLLHYFIAGMDSTYLTHIENKRKKK
jgi:hypothetical protein